MTLGAWDTLTDAPFDCRGICIIGDTLYARDGSDDSYMAFDLDSLTWSGVAGAAAPVALQLQRGIENYGGQIVTPRAGFTYVYTPETDAWTTAPVAGDVLDIIMVDGEKLYGLPTTLSTYWAKFYEGAWTTMSARTSQKNVAAALYKGKVYFFGGGDGFGASSSLRVFDLRFGTWTTLSSVGANAKYSCSMQALDDVLYVLAGPGDSDFQKYDIVAGTWTDLGSAPGSGYWSTAKHKGYLYAIELGASPSPFYRYHATELDESSPTFLETGVGSVDTEIEIEIPWFRPKKLQIPRTGDFAADDDAHRANERARQFWHDDPIEDFGTIEERQREE